MGEDRDIARVRFGAFELQPSERRLLHAGQPLAVGPRAFNLLVVLVERAGQLVSKDELLDRVWPNLVVEENNLQVQVSALRKILGAQAIATIAGHGYRFTLTPSREVVAPASLAAPAPYNLPRQVTSFVGRARELAEVKALLEHTRLLTLVGFGGIGKTRLSLQVAAAVADAYPDGVWLVELAPLTDARLVAQAVASVLGVREEPGRPVVEALLKHVAERRLLLLLDSCEHLIQAAAELTRQLLQAGPQLKLLATSRERLHLTGETTYVVPALTLPGPNPAITLPALTEYEAVRLFLDRAVAAQPAFQLTHHNAAAVADICRHVDGIPLAIELAAARARVLSVEKIAERLSDRFRLLTHGDPTALPHRQTLRAMIDWSYDLLPEPERALLRRLAVFAGGFTLEAAEAVGAGGEVDAIDVLDLLTELVEKSLVVVDAGAERYRLLDTVREYVQERLNESGEGDPVDARHLAFYLALAEQASPNLRGGPTQGAWLTRLDAERENLLAAHAACDHLDGAGEAGLRLVRALTNNWAHRGQFELGYRAMMEALARAQEPSVARCNALANSATLAIEFGQFDTAKVSLTEALAIATQVGAGDRTRADALRMLATVLQMEGNRHEARRYLEEARALARCLESKDVLAMVLTDLSELLRLEGDTDAAEALLEEALACARAVGFPLLAAFQLVGLAAIALDRGAGHRAVGMLREALAASENASSKPMAVDVMEKAAGLAASCEEWQRAAQLFGAATAQHERMGDHRESVDEMFLSPLIAKARAALGPAAFTAAEAAGRALSYEAALTETRAWLEIASGSRDARPLAAVSGLSSCNCGN